MKARIFSLLVGLCAFLCMAGRPAWAYTSENSLAHAYACSGHGEVVLYADEEIPIFVFFSVDGVLNFPGGGVVSSFEDTPWVFDIAGFGIVNIPVTGGEFEASLHGGGTLFLTFNENGQAVPYGFPESTFQNSVVLANIDSSHVSHLFVLNFSAANNNGLVQLTYCFAENQAAGNPLP